MNRLNPLHIIVLLVVVILFLYMQLSEIKADLKEELLAYKKSEKIAKELSAYKKFYGDQKRVQRSLQRIFSQHSLRNLKIETDYSNDGVKIQIKSIDLYALNSFMSKIFNGPYAIKKLNIKRVDETHASLELELKW